MPIYVKHKLNIPCFDFVEKNIKSYETFVKRFLESNDDYVQVVTNSNVGSNNNVVSTNVVSTNVASTNVVETNGVDTNGVPIIVVPMIPVPSQNCEKYHNIV